MRRFCSIEDHSKLAAIFSESFDGSSPLVAITSHFIDCTKQTDLTEMRTTKKTIRQRFVDVTKKNFSNVANVCEVFFNQESFEARRLAELAAVANTFLSFLLLAKMGLGTGIYDPEGDRVLLDCTFVIFCVGKCPKIIQFYKL